VFKLFKVSGTSMKPTAFPGDYIVATTLLKSFFLKKRLIIFFDETHSYVIKRIANKNKSLLTLKSDNTSTSSVFCDKKIQQNKVLFIVLLIIKKKYISMFFA
tara:strand:+ start:2043 stop:2348 length:306 start_codon:yes stop_codon:yes gene_type:complete